MRKNARGFTLMELMVVIIIVAILAAVAVPLYINYVRDAQRTEARGAIGAVITAEQPYYQLSPENPKVYTNDTFVPNPTAGPGGTQILNCDLTEALNNWTITVQDASDKGFTVIAVGNPGTPAAGLTVKYFFFRNREDGESKWVDGP